MPYRSAKQRAFLHAKHPDIAARWDRAYGGKVVPGKKKPPAKRAGGSTRKGSTRKGS